MKHAHDRRGYTLVEVLVALTVLAVGVTGILSLEQAAVASNRAGQQLTVATSLVRRWQDRLATDALQWNAPSSRTVTSDLGRDTTYLCNVVGCSTGSTAATTGWFVPSPPSGSLDSAAFDAFGNEVAVASPSARYCTNVRLAWLRPETVGTPGVLRAEVRVWWYREGATRLASYASCGTAAGLNAITTDLANVQYVQLTQTIAGHPL